MSWVAPLVVVTFVVGHVIGEIRGYRTAWKEANEKLDRILNLPKRD
jgi:hypothetical protein